MACGGSGTPAFTADADPDRVELVGRQVEREVVGRSAARSGPRPGDPRSASAFRPRRAWSSRGSGSGCSARLNERPPPRSTPAPELLPPPVTVTVSGGAAGAFGILHRLGEPGAVLRHAEHVDRQVLGLAVQLHLEALGQERLQHLGTFDARHAFGNGGRDRKPQLADPVGPFDLLRLACRRRCSGSP